MGTLLESDDDFASRLKDKCDVEVVVGQPAPQEPDNAAIKAMCAGWMLEAEKKEVQGLYRPAQELYDQVLAMDGRHGGALVGRARALVRSRRKKRAVEAVAAARRATLSTALAGQLLRCEARLAALTGDVSRAVDLWNRLLSQAPPAAADPEHVAAAGAPPPHGSRTVPRDATGRQSAADRVELAEVLLRAGAAQQAADLTLSALREWDTMPRGVALYAPLMASQKLHDEAVAVVVGALAVASDSKVLRQTLCAIASSGAGRKSILAMVDRLETVRSGGVVAFLGSCLKDFGATDLALTLFRRVADDAPTSAHAALDVAQTLAVRRADADALAVLLRWAERAGAAGLRMGPTGVGEPLAALAAQLGVPAEGAAVLAALRHAWEEVGRRAGALAAWKPGAREDVPAGAAAYAGPLGDVCAPASPPQGTAEAGGAVPLGRGEEVDAIAGWITVARLLFFRGLPREAQTVVSSISAARATWDLVKSRARNENAYALCLETLFRVTATPAARDADAPAPCPAATRQVFFFSESHAMPPAWRTVRVHGETVLLRPISVTGLKAWHLRDGTSFYPRVTYDAAVAEIPEGTTVVFAIGEIDCREGVLLAVEKGIYESLGEGMQRVVAIYLAAIRRVVKQRHITAIVHPVLPVLDVTRCDCSFTNGPCVNLARNRHHVRVFNRALRSALRGAKDLHFLDFEEELLTDDEKLRPQLNLDGTHIHPAYLEFFGRAMERLEQ